LATVHFTTNLQRHVKADPTPVEAHDVAGALAQVFARLPALRSYVLDDQGAIRRHVSIFVDGNQIRDRERQSDAVGPESEIWVMQALSGG
jgi:sulfur-carrier protein